MVAGVVTTFEPTTVDVRVQVAPGAPGVKITTACVVPVAMVAHPAAAKTAASNMKSASAFEYTFPPPIHDRGDHETCRHSGHELRASGGSGVVEAKQRRRTLITVQKAQ